MLTLVTAQQLLPFRQSERGEHSIKNIEFEERIPPSKCRFVILLPATFRLTEEHEKSWRAGFVLTLHFQREDARRTPHASVRRQEAGRLQSAMIC
jgi:hypothetical protein